MMCSLVHGNALELVNQKYGKICSFVMIETMLGTYVVGCRCAHLIVTRLDKGTSTTYSPCRGNKLQSLSFLTRIWKTWSICKVHITWHCCSVCRRTYSVVGDRETIIIFLTSGTSSVGFTISNAAQNQYAHGWDGVKNSGLFEICVNQEIVVFYISYLRWHVNDEANF